MQPSIAQAAEQARPRLTRADTDRLKKLHGRKQWDFA
jgi:hypothetical protein